MSFVENFYLFFLIMILKTCMFKFSVLFRIHSLSDKSLRVLQLPTHVSILTSNAW